MKFKPMSRFAKIAVAMLLTAATLFSLASCKPKDPLDPNKPVTLKIWHYYPKHIEIAADTLVNDFNETVGKQRGVVVEMENKNTEDALMSAVLDAEPDTDLPDMFLCSSDNAFIADKNGLLADIGKYFSAAELGQYHQSFIEEGRIGTGDKLKFFPLAKAIDILVLNQTDWEDFASDKGYTHADLATYEDIARVAADYYNWTDAKTPNTPNDGKAFFDGGSVANMIFSAAKQLDGDVFTVSGGKGRLALTDEILKELWDYYYVPYISGYYTGSNYDGESMGMGKALAFVSSTDSNKIIPTTVETKNGEYDISPVALPAPRFDDGKDLLVAQGDGMVVAKSTYKTEYASAVFLKWITDTKQNSLYAICADGIPAKAATTDLESVLGIMNEYGYDVWQIRKDVLGSAYEKLNGGTGLFAPKVFEGSGDARVVLENHLKNKAITGYNEVRSLMQQGKTYAYAIAACSSSDTFVAWKNDFKAEIAMVIG